MSVTMSHSLQNYGTGDELALALKQYGNYVVEAYYDARVVEPYIWSMPITNGNSFQFPATAMATSSHIVPGVLRTGANQPEVEERTVTLDAQETGSDRYYSLTADFITHWPYQQPFAKAHAMACAMYVEDKLLRMIAIGARLAARGTGVDAFPAGSNVNSDTTTSTTVIATNYPVSLTGSLALQGDLDKLAYTFDTKNVPRENRVAFMSWYLYRVLLQDKTLMSADYQDGVNDMLRRDMKFTQGFYIQPTNRMPAANDESNTAYPAAYRVNTSADATGGTSGGLHGSTSNYTTCVLAIAGRDAVGQVTALGGVRPVGPEWYTNLNAWFLGAKVWDGAKWLRPEACGEIVLS